MPKVLLTFRTVATKLYTRGIHHARTKSSIQPEPLHLEQVAPEELTSCRRRICNWRRIPRGWLRERKVAGAEKRGCWPKNCFTKYLMAPVNSQKVYCRSVHGQPLDLVNMKSSVRGVRVVATVDLPMMTRTGGWFFPWRESAPEKCVCATAARRILPATKADRDKMRPSSRTG